MYDSVLIPTDGSEASLTAIDHGIDLADKYDATVHAIYVIDARVLGGDVASFGQQTRDTIEAELTEEGEAAIGEITDRADAMGLRHESEILTEIPYRGITDYADRHDIDLVVMSSHGRSGVTRYILGSVTERVLRETDRPVLVVST